MGLNSLRPEGTLSFMLSHLTLRMQARMKQYAIRPVSLLSASGQYNMLGEPINFSFAFILYLAKGEFPLTCVKILHYEQIIVTMCREALESTGYMIKYDSVNKATFNIKRKFD